jgi:hypothetical protein
VSGRRRNALLVVAVLAAVGIAYLAATGLGGGGGSTSPAASDAGTGLAGSQLLLRAVDRSAPSSNGSLSVIKDGRRRPLAGSSLECERVYFAGGRGLCLVTAEAGEEEHATVFDSSLQPLEELPMKGLPSRARVSSDGRYGAMTSFVNGHGYENAAGGFTTDTAIIDMRKGRRLADLASFHVTKAGRPFEASDFNYWGVTFAADANRFYATLRSHGSYYLVEGDVRRRTMRVLREGVECPSLSPDGTRIAFKSRIGNEDRWRLKVLDLKTLRAHPVAGARPIDDQAEWLDDDTLVYSNELDVFTVSADAGGSPPRLAVRDAASPVALDPGR